MHLIFSKGSRSKWAGLNYLAKLSSVCISFPLSYQDFVDWSRPGLFPMLNWSVYVPFFSFSKDLPSLRGLCLIVVPSWALCMHIIPVYHRFTRLEKAELSNCQSKLNIIHPFFLAFHTGSVWATAWSVGAVKVESSPGAVPLLGTLGKVVQVSAAGPHQRVLRGENRDLLRVAGWGVTEGGDDCAGLSLLIKNVFFLVYE